MTDEELQQELLSPLPGAEQPPPVDDADLQAELLQPLPAEAPEVAAPEPAPATPQPTLSQDGRVYVVSRAGELGTIDQSELPTIGQQGFSLASQDDVAKQLEAEEYGDLGSQVGAGLEGVAQGATLGGYGAIASAIDDEYGEDLRKRAEYNPKTALAGELVGAVAPALLSGGTGAVGTAARFIPSAVEANLGMKLAGALGSKAAAWGAGRAGQLGARVAATALEGAVDNATRSTLDDAANGDVDITAERMLDAAWDGALVGGAFELGLAGLGAAGRGARKLVSKVGKADVPEGALAAQADELEAAVAPASQSRPRADIDADLQVAEQRLAEADVIGDPITTSEAEEAVTRLQAERDNAIVADNGLASDNDLELQLQVDTPEQAAGGWEALKAKFSKVKNAKDLAQQFDDRADDLTKSITGRLDDLQRLKQNELDRYLNRSNKPKAIKAALEQEGTQWSPEQANRVLQENEQALNLIETIRKDYQLGDEVARRKLAPLKAAQEAIQGVKKHLTNLKAQGPVSPESRILRGSLEDIGAVFWAEDSLKSYLGQLAKKKGEVLTEAEANLQKIYMRKRAALQDPKLYGSKLAEMQTVTNAIESKAIPAGRVFHSQFGRSKGLLGEHAGEHGFDELLELDPGKIKGLLKNLDEADSYKDELDFIKGLNRNIDLAEAKAKYYPVPEGVQGKIAEARKTVNAIVEDLKSAKILKKQRDEAARLAREHEGIDKVWMALDAMAAFVPGVSLAGRFIGSAGSAVKLAAGIGPRAAEAAPKGRLGQLADGAIQTQEGVQKAADSTFKNFVGGLGKKPLREAGVMSANAIKRAIDQAQALQDPESRESQELGLNTAEIGNTDPGLAQALQGKVLARATFIASKIPPPIDPDDPLGRAAVPVDPITQRKIGRYVEAAMDPAKALQRLARGTGSPEDIETLKALYPRLYQDYTKRVVRKVQESNKPLTVAAKNRLAFTLGVPVDRSQTPAYLSFYQSVPPLPGMTQGNPAPKPKGSGKFDPDTKGANQADEILTIGDA